MGISAAAIRKMVELGLDAPAIADLCEVLEAGFALPLADATKAGNARRQRERRARKAEEEAVSRDGHVTRHVTGHVTDLSSPSLPPKPPNPPPPIREEQTTRVRASRRMPEGWRPTDDLIVFAKQEGFTAGELERELSKMKDHQFRDAHIAWDAVFRNWIRRAAETHRKTSDVRPHHNPRPSDRDSRLQRMFAGAVAAADGPDDELSTGGGLRGSVGPLRIVGGSSGA